MRPGPWIRPLTAFALLGVAGCVAPPPPKAWLEVDVARGLAPEPGEARPARVEVVMDVTPSMAAATRGKSSNLDAARAGAAQLLRSIPPDVPATLVAFGATGAACDASLLVLGPESGRPAVLALRAEELTPAAEASLASTLDSVATALAAEKVAERTRVVVFTDLVAQCGGDPCAAGEKLLATGATLDLVVLGDGSVPACLRSPVLPSGLPASVSRRTDTDPVSFRLVAAPAGPAREPTDGVAGERPVRVDAGPATVELALTPPLDVPVVLPAGTLLRLRVIDFPGASPPVRDWLVETAAPPADASQAASPP
ncbi:MAG TPA: hypothetical protein VKM54_02875 [Myxococcota bacterium]|nr:hypothetical protein [Myxococcota bacterium]